MTARSTLTVLNVSGEMNFLPLIESKREGKTLTPEQIQAFIREFTAGKIPDYQMAAMLMAIYFRGLNTAETTALTLAMRDSGDVLKFPKDKRPLVDKHSTGGTLDKLDFTEKVAVEVKPEKAGYIAKCDARIIGEVIRDLGSGRLTQESAINCDVGVDQIAKPGGAWKNREVFAAFTPPIRPRQTARLPG